jgi:hypothetical protein
MPSQFLDLAVPTRSQNHALHDSTRLPGTTMGFSVAVTVAGTIVARMLGDAADVNIDVTAGTHFFPGNWSLIKTTGTATVANSRAVVYIFDPSVINY